MRLTVEPAEAGQRLDVVVATRAPELSRAQAQRLIRAGDIVVDGVAVKPRFIVTPGQQITVSIPPPQPVGIEPQEFPLDIRYEDSDVVVVNKPAGVVVHPGAGRREGTLVNALLAHCTDLSGIGGELRPGIVHRLDKDTSGLIAAAKNDFAHASLAAQLKARTAERRYLALIWGRPDKDHFTVRTLFGRHPKHRIMMAVLDPQRAGKPGAREALTEVRVREHLGPMTLIEARLHTGRTHQIRVHASYIGHPVVGDPTYGGKRQKAELAGLDAKAQRLVRDLHGQALHAYHLAFDHPRSGERIEVKTHPPDDMQALIAHMRGVKEHR
ncbi:MAG: RluA family pseudouridine synthase [Armatimonadota bacterium]|nr:MAG: RluA family pseudouridine synthase [Armatimonadota bacterium]